MSENQQSPFLVDPYSDPVIIKIHGRVSFMNSAPLRDFFGAVMKERRTFVIDFADCTSMDSTFLGILAGVSLALRRQDPPGSLILCRLGTRNLELVRNLGLHRMMTVDSDTRPMQFDGASRALEPQSNKAELESARLVLEAHENLVEVDDGNRKKFQDVISFLKNQIERM